ncbi:hypothetical protein PTQ19_12115 [Microbacterium esteraromaticum]|uniref:hypothetical protein n=1 Tax=Microbacterium esteraromaticum TaxID=57043 RepID=UPI0023682581|nr:hypothetical protein [Microbacterium esteraromaticum]WDH78256.1 hypothetical protein PTQ19_12115 [Microbacterium esteraromaticum]
MIVRKTVRRPLCAVAAVAIGVGMLTACSSAAQDTAEKAVTDYVTALSEGDAKLAHEINPYSPIITDGLAASAAGEPIQIVEVGEFAPADASGLEKIPTPSVEVGEGEPDSEPGLGEIDWNDTSWTGLEADQPDPLDGAAKHDIQEGAVPVTYLLGDTETTVPIGVAFGRDKNGEIQYAFREVPLGGEMAARFGTDVAFPALPGATVGIERIDTDEDADEASSYLGDAVDATGEAASKAVEVEIIRDGTVSGEAVTFSEREPLLLLPGVYELNIEAPTGDALWASPGLEEPIEVVLEPGQSFDLELPEQQITDAGRQAIVDYLSELADGQFEALTTYELSDRGQACGALAPGKRGLFSSGASEFEKESGDWFTEETTNIASGGIVVNATSTNGATGSRSGNGSKETFADEAFCAGVQERKSNVYDVPVEVVSSSMEPGSVDVSDDGHFTTTTPWRFTVSTKITTHSSEDAAGERIYGRDPVATTYTGTVDLTWEPSGVMKINGDVKPSDDDDD